MDIDEPKALAAALEGTNLGTFREIVEVRYQMLGYGQSGSTGVVDLVVAQDRSMPSALRVHLRLSGVSRFRLSTRTLGWLVLECVGDHGWEGVRWSAFDGEQGGEFECRAGRLEVLELGSLGDDPPRER